MNLRIRKIAEMVRDGLIVADIGTDHAQLPIYLISLNKSPAVYACDIGPGPLKSAHENICRAGYSDRIKTILSNGFENVPSDVQCAVIAGMGFYTIRDILEAESFNRLSEIQQLIIESNTDLPFLRKWICSRDWSLMDERLVYDKKHFYVVMEIDMNRAAAYTEQELLCGPILMKRSGTEFQSYADHCLKKIEKALNFKPEDDILKKQEIIWKSVMKK